MKFKIVFHLVSFLVMILSLFMGVVAAVSYLMDDPDQAWQGMLASAGITLVIGGAMWVFTRTTVELSRREGIGIVVFGWVTATLLSCLPFHLTGAMNSLFDSFFEAASGLTTTGASVMSNLEAHSRAILLWRAVTHFLGGMGILVLVVAIIPYLGVGGMQIYQAEVTGPSKDRLTPRITSTAKLLWGVYLLLNVILIILLKFGGMDWFDAVCHAFATISTGGFSTRSMSIASFDSLYIETVIVVFMLLSGINFALHFRALRGDLFCYFKDSECRFYLGVWILAVAVISLNLFNHDVWSAGDSLRHSIFYATSILTCTGFGTVDYDQWPITAKCMLLVIFFIGGCAGSTSGGIKQIRLMVLLKKMVRDVRSFLKPQAIYTVKIGRQQISSDIVFNIAVYFFIYITTVAVGTLIMSIYTTDILSAFSAVISCLANVGPGFSTVGPVMNYEQLPDAAKLLLIVIMLAGRLEFYTLLVLLLPSFWRK
ncbi:MAG TPA: TrkH family potassium uptake protein [Kiritimatiellia bacterium]|nr:TrkH family potassium uptake protein [Kiritimatiellia bacterium]